MGRLYLYLRSLFVVRCTYVFRVRGITIIIRNNIAEIRLYSASKIGNVRVCRRL